MKRTCWTFTKKMACTLGFLMYIIVGAHAQTAVRTNLFDDALLMPNISVEMSISNHYSLSLGGRYAPIALADKHKWKNVSVSFEGRYWPFIVHRRWYVGVNTYYSLYNTAGLPFYGLKRRRKQGILFGAGLTGGYAWQLSPRWNIEAGAGVGYVYSHFKKYDYGKCGLPYGSFDRHRILPTEISLSLVYFLKKR